MKSERRHELQHNDLAEWLTDTYEQLRPYRNSILGVTLLIVVVSTALAIWHSHSLGQATEGWNAVEIPQAILQYPAAQMSPVYQAPQYIDMMEKASATYAGTSAGDWAQVLAADGYLFFGENELMGQREAGVQHLNAALNSYEKAKSVAPGPMARERIMFGIARCRESLGQLKEATAAYDELNKDYPNGTYKAIAEQRLGQLGRPELQEFYDAVAKFTPKAKKDKEKGKPAASGPAGKVENMTLPESPSEPLVPAIPVRPGESGSAAAPHALEAPSLPVEPVKPSTESAKPTGAAPALPMPTLEPPKTTGSPAAATKTSAK